MICKILIMFSMVKCLDSRNFVIELKTPVTIEQEVIVKREIPAQNRIYEGVNCPAEEYKRMVEILIDAGYFQIPVCGATLINKNWVLTAAHCVEKAKFTYAVVTGITPSDNSQAVASKVSNIYLHEQFRIFDGISENDIALLLLNESIAETEYIKYANLPKKDLGDIRGYCPEGRIKGWGAIKDMVPPKSLQQLQCLDVSINNVDCRDYEQYQNLKNSGALICSLDTNNKSTSCSGDSGGPLMCKGIQIGITSFGVARRDPLTGVPLECVPEFPQGYTRVDKYLGFITKTMEANTSKQNSPNVGCISIYICAVILFK